MRTPPQITAQLLKTSVPLRTVVAVDEALHAAALVSAERFTKADQKKAERTAARRKRFKTKIWVEVTSQPKKTKTRYVGRATFYWREDSEKKKHSAMITLGGRARLTVKGRKLFVKPAGGGEGYFYGETKDAKDGGAETKSGEGSQGEGAEAKKGRKTKVEPAARVGVPADTVPVPPAIPRLPNLTEEERAVEERFAAAFEKNPDGLASKYLEGLKLRAEATGNPTDAITFVTDDTKNLTADYTPPDTAPEDVAARRAEYNTMLHQTANAIAKRAFLKHLDELAKLPEGDPKRSVLVTSGGCGSGKGFCLKNVEQTKSLAAQVGGIWDAAGEQNATENPWLLEECRKRGIKAKFIFVDSDPEKTWAGPWGVVNRAATPPPKGEGRMVDARLFADSYARGARNMKAFMDENQGSDDAEFVILSSRDGAPKVVDKISDEALALKEDDVYKWAVNVVEKDGAPTEAIKRGATKGKRIWKDAESGGATATASTLQDAYQEYFKSKLEEYGVSSPAELDDDEKADFFKIVKKGWEKGKGPVKAATEVDELAATLIANFEGNLANLDGFYEQQWKGDQAMIALQEKAASSDSVSARIDRVAEALSALRLPTDTLLAIEEAAELLAGK